MGVSYYDLDRKVLNQLQDKEQEIKEWQGKASGIADYVASWGVERFWALSQSSVLKGGQSPSEATKDKEETPNYYAWEVARIVLCSIIEKDLDIKACFTNQQFQEKFGELDFNQQVLFTDLLIEIADTIQFWTMRLKENQPKTSKPEDSQPDAG